MKLTDFLSKYAVSSIVTEGPPLTQEPLPSTKNLSSDPATWPDDWRYAFIERSGMLMDTGVTQEEADKVAESLVRKQHAEENHLAATGGGFK